LPRRKSKKPKTLWTEYPEYTPINNIDERPLFDEAQVSDEHRVLGQIIRENWHLIHPLARDYLLSSAQEWRQILNTLHSSQSTLESKQQQIDNFQSSADTQSQRLKLEKDAEIERIKEEIEEKYREMLVQKDQEIAQYKILVKSVKSGLSDATVSQSDIETNAGIKDQRILELEKLVQELKAQVKSQELESMNIQTGISKNFQKQINDITTELYEKQDQIDKLREVLNKAKEQLISFKEKTHELTQRNVSLEEKVKERDEKLKKIIQSFDNLD
jgi:chromosome segregation ATPase